MTDLLADLQTIGKIWEECEPGNRDRDHYRDVFAASLISAAPVLLAIATAARNWDEQHGRHCPSWALCTCTGCSLRSAVAALSGLETRP